MALLSVSFPWWNGTATAQALRSALPFIGLGLSTYAIALQLGYLVPGTLSCQASMAEVREELAATRAALQRLEARLGRMQAANSQARACE
jgi:hypothetical protein